MLRAAPLLLAAALLLPSTACAGSRIPAIVDDAAAFALSDRSHAATLLEQALPEASPRDRPSIQLWAGEHRRLMGEADLARTWFQAVLDNGSRHANPEAAEAGIALLDAASSANSTVIALLRALSDSDLLDSQNADRFMVLAVVAAAEGEALTFEQHRAKAISFAAAPPEHSERILTRLDAITVAAEPGELPIDYVLEASDVSDFDLAERALASGDGSRIETLVARIRAQSPTEAESLAADYLLRRVDAVTVRPSVIGVLLPLSGRYATVGTQVKEALEFGFDRGNGNGRFLVVDSGTTAESAISAMESLVLNEGVIAIAGPLLSDQGPGVARAAEALRVPLIGLAQTLEPEEGQTFVTRLAVSVSDQVDALLDHAVNTAGMRSYGIFAPDNDYGHRAAEAFTSTASRLGATVVTTQFYDPTSNDMTSAARSMARADYTARRSELSRLRREAEARGGDPSTVSLPPKLDFEAIFVPDNASRVPLACAALAYEEFPVGEFQPRPGEPTIVLMGLNSWNNTDLLTQGGAYVRNSLFTDLFVSDDDASNAFEASYRATTGRNPSALEAVMVDIGGLTAIATQQSITTRSEFRDALFSATPEDSITGISGINSETSTAFHRMRILTIDRNSIVVVK